MESRIIESLKRDLIETANEMSLNVVSATIDEWPERRRLVNDIFNEILLTASLFRY